MAKSMAIGVALALVAGAGVVAWSGGRGDEGAPVTTAKRAEILKHHAHHHGHDHVHPAGIHSCSLVTPAGVAELLDRAAIVVVGAPLRVEEAEPGIVRVVFAVDEVLAGSDVAGSIRVSTDGTRTLDVLVGEQDFEHDPMPVGGRLMLFLRPAFDVKLGDVYAMARNGLTVSAAYNGVVWYAEDSCRGMVELARELGATRDNRLSSQGLARRATALATAITTGGPITRQRAAIDFRNSQPLVDALTQQQIAAIAGVLETLDNSDPALSDMLTLLASRQDPSLVPSLISPLLRTRGDRAIEPLARVLSTESLSPVAADSLAAQLKANHEPTQRRLLAFVLARIGETAHSHLESLLSDADRDVAAEALIGLAGTRHVAARSLAFDLIRPMIGDHPVVDSTDPIDVRLRTRELRDVKHGWHTGERLQVMAAAYFVARSPEVEDREWLRQRLERIASFPVREFIRSRLEHVWMTYDTPW